MMWNLSNFVYNEIHDYNQSHNFLGKMIMKCNKTEIYCYIQVEQFKIH